MDITKNRPKGEEQKNVMPGITTSAVTVNEIQD